MHFRAAVDSSGLTTSHRHCLCLCMAKPELALLVHSQTLAARRADLQPTCIQIFYKHEAHAASHRMSHKPPAASGP